MKVNSDKNTPHIVNSDLNAPSAHTENVKISAGRDKTLQKRMTSSINSRLFIALALVSAYIINRTRTGLHLRSVGENPSTADSAGINVNRAIFTAMAISGVLAGIAGATQLLGMGQRISIFSSQESYGFQGIIVALIGASNPIGCIFGGLFYGALKYGSAKLNLIGAPSEVIDIITGTIVFFIAISDVFKLKNRRGVRR